VSEIDARGDVSIVNERESRYTGDQLLKSQGNNIRVGLRDVGRVCLRIILAGEGAWSSQSVFIQELTCWKKILRITQMFRPFAHFFSSEQVVCEVIKQEKYLKAYKAATTEFQNLVGGIKFRDTKIGDGLTVERDDVVKVQFTGRLLGGREIETTTHNSGGTTTFTAGGSDVVKGVSEGVIGMMEYGSRELLVPPSMHYGDKYPNEILVYDVMVRSVVRKHGN
jgi:FKBP-type peptidyl-prolyl cis-trans isomerase